MNDDRPYTIIKITVHGNAFDLYVDGPSAEVAAAIRFGIREGAAVELRKQGNLGPVLIGCDVLRNGVFTFKDQVPNRPHANR